VFFPGQPARRRPWRRSIVRSLRSSTRGSASVSTSATAFRNHRRPVAPCGRVSITRESRSTRAPARFMAASAARNSPARSPRFEPKAT